MKYPDVTGIFAEKARMRRARASLSIQEKLVVLEKLRREADALRKTARAARKRENA